MLKNQTKESFATYMREWAKRNKANTYELRKERLKAYRARNNSKIKARSAVSRALNRGKLQKETCKQCDREDSHAHHSDYKKPLEVIWLCPPHHAEVHNQDFSRRPKYLSHA